ncbi:hypothetical protein DMN91_005241 [Ooceraea biroi]|uniref:G domain-containing protein n=1 Tax=Ooceraea biroi TaxID=2015173 RepID=A0A3L8DS15_OOCBI|nr:nitric oxide-associated protein 1 isoform X2 [Ooceraea biroi]RLU22963.1 hypothetical protein DMN91_005241 [Ooceraea biroi]
MWFRLLIIARSTTLLMLLMLSNPNRVLIPESRHYEKNCYFAIIWITIKWNVFLDNDKGDDNDLPKENTNIEEEDVIRPVHMPYASTDEYTSVDTSLNNSEKNKNASDQSFDENITSLNEKYMALYDKYLEAKTAVSGEEKEVTLKDYMKEFETTRSYKTDFSTVPPNWMVDFEEFDDTLEEDTWFKNYGTPDPNSSVSLVPCGGCGAFLHCRDPAIPGYLPSELFQRKSERRLRRMICQRCHFLKYYNTALDVKVSPDEYINLLKVIKRKKCAVILMVDLTDFPCSIWPDISSVLSPGTAVFVVGNKIDLLPQDSKGFFVHVKECLSKAVENTGIPKENIKHVELVSAQTGYGIEQLINKLHSLWKYKGDVYLIGCTNVGKSSLFNALLQSDYCKVQAVDLIQRATISPWPGTTLNLLKFPILNPVKWRLYERMMRLKSERVLTQAEASARMEEFHITGKLKYATLQNRIGRTFRSKSELTRQINPFLETKFTKRQEQFGFDENEEEYRESRWCYDTPGTIQPDQILDLLTTQELLTVLPDQIISPRTFILHSSQTIFLGGMGRLDYLEGDKFIRCTIFLSDKIPVTVTLTKDADSVYDELLKTKAFVVPENNPNRLKYWPAMGSKEMEVTCIGRKESVADVVLSNAGWIAISGKKDQRVLLKAWTPQGRGLYLRTPALLKSSVILHGKRVSDIPTYKSGRQVYNK